MLDRTEKANDRLSRCIFSKCKLSRKFIRTGPFLFKIYDIECLGIYINAEGEADTIEEAIHKALDYFENIQKNLLKNQDGEKNE